MTYPNLDDREQFEHCFGAAAAEALSNWLGGAARMEMAKVIEGGGSGAKIAAVYLYGIASDQRKVILKLSDTPAENKAYMDAWDTSGGFQHHLAKPIRVVPVKGVGEFVIQEIAGDDLRDWVALSSPGIDAEVVAARFGTVVGSVLTEWSPGHADHIRDEPVHRLMKMNLGARIAKDGKLHRWAEARGLLDDKVGLITLGAEGDSLPNPFMLLKQHGAGAHVVKKVLTGRAHGDLHPGNVLIKAVPRQSPEFVLIDLGWFRPDAPLSRDITQLFLSLLWQTIHVRASACQSERSGTAPERGARQVTELVSAIRDAGRQCGPRGCQGPH